MGVQRRSRVFVDANVLYGRTTRDWLGLLTVTGPARPFQVYFSNDVLGELLYKLRLNNPDWDGGQITSIVDKIRATFEGGLVEDFKVDGSYVGSDPADRHVHAAAVECRADYLITGNIRHFPVDPETTPYEVLAPDEFFVLVAEAAPDLVGRCVDSQIAYWHTRGQDIDLKGQLERADCPKFADIVQAALQHRALRG